MGKDEESWKKKNKQFEQETTELSPHKESPQKDLIPTNDDANLPSTTDEISALAGQSVEPLDIAR